MRALFATTTDDQIPKSVFDVKDWLEDRKTNKTVEREGAGFDTTGSQLQALGYK
jgi:hypothetical protein